MSAGWLHYHRYPPKRKCPLCGKRHYATRIAVASNGEDFWKVFCTNKRLRGFHDGKAQGATDKRNGRPNRYVVEVDPASCSTPYGAGHVEGYVVGYSGYPIRPPEEVAHATA
jgi:hypothetical protein